MPFQPETSAIGFRKAGSRFGGQVAGNWFFVFSHKSIFPWEKVDGQVAGHLAANFSLAQCSPVGRQLVFFAISPYFPRRKLTAKLPATWPPTFGCTEG